MNLLRTTSMPLLVLVVIGLMPGLVLAAGPVGQGSGAVEPIVVLDQSGVEVSVVGSTTMQLDPAGGTYLTLERITLAEGATFGPVTATGSELVVMVDGALQQQDERGFWARMDAPYQIVVAPGDQVSWTASVETSLLRLRLTDATPETATFDGVEIEGAAQFRLDSLPEAPALVFIAEAALSGRGDGGRLEHDGTVGVAVESGAVDVLSPSGLEGRLGEGQIALYSDGAPIEFLGTGGEDTASAWLVGISPTARTLEGASTASAEASPADETADVAALGKTKFQFNCQICHKPGGTAPDLVEAGGPYQALDYATLYPIVRDGAGGHTPQPGPIAEFKLTDDDIANIAAYIREQTAP